MPPIMDWITNPEIWIALLTLTVLEIVNGSKRKREHVYVYESTSTIRAAYQLGWA
jgi:hypothetical protein